MRIIYETNHVPESGKYREAIVEDTFSGNLYLYDCQGTWINIGLNFFQQFSLDGGTA